MEESKNVRNRGVTRRGQTNNAGRRRIGEKRKGLIATRRNRRFGQTINRRNRLERAQAVSRNANGRNRMRNRVGNRNRRFGFGFRQRGNYSRTKLFVGGLHNSVNDLRLYRLFRKEGRILKSRVVYDRFGNSKNFGIIEFAYPRDALRTIQKWNNTEYLGYFLNIQYKRNTRNERRFNNRERNFGGNYGNRNNDGNRNFRDNYRNRNNNGFQNRNNFPRFRARGRGRGGNRNNFY